MSRQGDEQMLRQEGFAQDQIDQAFLPISVDEMTAYEADHADDADSRYYRNRDLERQQAYLAAVATHPPAGSPPDDPTPDIRHLLGSATPIEQEPEWAELAEAAMIEALEDDDLPEMDSFELCRYLLRAAMPSIKAGLQAAQQTNVDQ